MPLKLINRLRRKRDFYDQVSSSRARLYRTAYAWCHDPDLADDLVQQTLCNALQNYTQLRDPQALNGWLFRIMARCLADHRRLSREVETDAELSGTETYTPEDATGDMEIIQRVRTAVKKLPLEQRQVVSLVDLEGFSYAEVASILDTPVGTVMSRLSRGRRALHKRLIAANADEEDLASERVRRIK